MGTSKNDADSSVRKDICNTSICPRKVRMRSVVRTHNFSDPWPAGDDPVERSGRKIIVAQTPPDRVKRDKAKESIFCDPSVTVYIISQNYPDDRAMCSN